MKIPYQRVEDAYLEAQHILQAFRAGKAFNPDPDNTKGTGQMGAIAWAISIDIITERICHNNRCLAFPGKTDTCLVRYMYRENSRKYTQWEKTQICKCIRDLETKLRRLGWVI